MPNALAPRRRHYSWRTTFKKVDETIAQSKCEHSVQPFDKSKVEKIYKKVFSSIDNFLNLCYTNMNYCVKMRRLEFYWTVGGEKDGENNGKLSQR